LFSGAVWAATDALALGLIDGIGDLRSVLRERFGPKVRLVTLSTGRSSLLSRWFNRAPAVAGGLLDPAEILAVLEERATWSRLGL
jgi:ClpP class serine protease